MKSILKLIWAGLFSLLIGTAAAMNYTGPDLSFAQVQIGSSLVLFSGILFFSQPVQGAFREGVDIDQVKTELGAYFRTGTAKAMIKAFFYQQSQIAQYTKTITKVKGKWPSFHSIASRVIQGFSTTWNELGSAKIKVNELDAYHLKVNFPIVPADVLNSWLATYYEEGNDLAGQPISVYILQEILGKAIVRDVEYLSGNGVYDANDLGTFGKSMNGLIKVLELGVANADNPMYKIALNALTDENIVDEVEKFEDAIPDVADGLITKIFMSNKNLKRYRRAYRAAYGTDMDFQNTATRKTWAGDRELVGLTCLNGSDQMFATTDDNFVRLIDLFDVPRVTDIQKHDYKLKIFMEAHLGINFLINPAVFVADYEGGSGFDVSGGDTLNDLYFG